MFYYFITFNSHFVCVCAHMPVYLGRVIEVSTDYLTFELMYTLVHYISQQGHGCFSQREQPDQKPRVRNGMAHYQSVFLKHISV